jgi:hypothetical protein
VVVAVCAMHAVTAGALATHDPLSWGLTGPLSTLAPVAALLVLSRAFLFVALPAWVAYEIVTWAWDARSAR